MKSQDNNVNRKQYSTIFYPLYSSNFEMCFDNSAKILCMLLSVVFTDIKKSISFVQKVPSLSSRYYVHVLHDWSEAF